MTATSSAWTRALDWFAGGRAGDDRLRASRTAAFCLLTAGLGPVFCAVLAMAGFPDTGLQTLLFLSAFGLPLTILRRGGPVTLAGHLACALGATPSIIAGWATTGPLGPSVLPLLLLPVAGTMLVGPRAGWAWLAAVVTLLCAFGLGGDLAGWSDRAAHIPPPVRVIAASSVLVAVGTIIQGATAAMVTLEARHRADLDVMLAELEQRVDERTVALRREVDERRRAEDAAQRATRAKSAFLANMSHELRTPLNAILGYTEMVDEELADRPELREDLGRVTTSAQHLLRLIQDILDLARVEQGRIELRLAEVDVAQVVAGAIEMIRPQVEERGNRIVVDATDAAAWADADRVQQILLNLLSNANKFTDGGEIRVSAQTDGRQVRVAVRDTGVGVPEAERERIFERFAQVDESSTRRAGGAGLGLAVARELARKMGGDLHLEPAAGGGSVFTIQLPASEHGRSAVTVLSD